jgi:hypothetical protein
MKPAVRIGLTLITAAVVVALVLLDAGLTSPGDVSAVHAGMRGPFGRADCEACHGSREVALADACLECHAAIDAQLAAAKGLHGTLEPAAARDCASCHAEHHGRDFAIVSDHSFLKAGFTDRQSFDHGVLGYEMEGVHTVLGCADCHPHADVAVLPEGEARFLGLGSDCAACHEDPHEGRMADACESCHGQQEPFALVAEFMHNPRFPLEGAHSHTACLDCHPQEAMHSIEALAGKTPPPAWRDCADCHPNQHEERFLAGAACDDCHPNSHKSFSEASAHLTAMQHAESGFPLDDPHAGLACEECHPRGLEGGFATRFPGREPDACAACHDDPHDGQFGVGSSQASCLSCHQRHTFLPHLFDLDQHARTNFALTGAHREAECADCHATPAAPAGAPRPFRGTDQECAACHADAHQGAFAGDAASDSGRACSACHSTAHFRDVDRAGFAHAPLTGFALEGAHARADCEACHARAAQPDELGRSFGRAAEAPPGDASGCTACHANPHGDAFDRPGQPEPAGGATGCARCHDLETFGALRGRRFDHGAWTSFALTGAHRLAACTACHEETKNPAFAHGKLGPSTDKFPGPRGECATCHADAHGGALAQADGGAPGTDCAACHATTSFRALTQAFDHARWTGFALEGAHAAIGCADCHAPLRLPEVSGRRFARAQGEACSDCHADPHAGQFRGANGGPTDCARCHATSGSFPAASRFDHQRDARFALDETHRSLDCAACHQAYPVPGGKPVVRYKPLGTSCKDCHGFK